MLSPATDFILGLDGFVFCLVLGRSCFSPSRRILLAMAFGFCDALATLLGAGFPPHAVWPGLVPCVTAACLTFAFLLPSQARALAFVFPVPLSLDNFVDAANGHVAPLVHAVSIGVLSASLALAGLYFAAVVAARRNARRRAVTHMVPLQNAS